MTAVWSAAAACAPAAFPLGSAVVPQEARPLRRPPEARACSRAHRTVRLDCPRRHVVLVQGHPSGGLRNQPTTSCTAICVHNGVGRSGAIWICRCLVAAGVPLPPLGWRKGGGNSAAEAAADRPPGAFCASRRSWGAVSWLSQRHLAGARNIVVREGASFSRDAPTLPPFTSLCCNHLLHEGRRGDPAGHGGGRQGPASGCRHAGIGGRRGRRPLREAHAPRQPPAEVSAGPPQRCIGRRRQGEVTCLGSPRPRRYSAAPGMRSASTCSVHARGGIRPLGAAAGCGAAQLWRRRPSLRASHGQIPSPSFSVCIFRSLLPARSAMAQLAWVPRSCQCSRKSAPPRPLAPPPRASHRAICHHTTPDTTQPFDPPQVHLLVAQLVDSRHGHDG